MEEEEEVPKEESVLISEQLVALHQSLKERSGLMKQL